MPMQSCSPGTGCNLPASCPPTFTPLTHSHTSPPTHPPTHPPTRRTRCGRRCRSLTTGSRRGMPGRRRSSSTRRTTSTAPTAAHWMPAWTMLPRPRPASPSCPMSRSPSSRPAAGASRCTSGACLTCAPSCGSRRSRSVRRGWRGRRRPATTSRPLDAGLASGCLDPLFSIPSINTVLASMPLPLFLHLLLNQRNLTPAYLSTSPARLCSQKSCSCTTHACGASASMASCYRLITRLTRACSTWEGRKQLGCCMAAAAWLVFWLFSLEEPSLWQAIVVQLEGGAYRASRHNATAVECCRAGSRRARHGITLLMPAAASAAAASSCEPPRWLLPRRHRRPAPPPPQPAALLPAWQSKPAQPGMIAGAGPWSASSQGCCTIKATQACPAWQGTVMPQLMPNCRPSHSILGRRPLQSPNFQPVPVGRCP